MTIGPPTRCSRVGASAKVPSAHRVAVLIINWNSIARTVGAIESVQRDLEGCDLPYEITVVDNGSRDPAEARALNEVAGVRLVRLASNTGFTGGMNAAARASEGDVLLFYDNDARPRSKGSIASLFDILERHPEAAAVGPATTATARRSSASEVTSVGFLCGAALMVWRQDFDAAGGFDPALFAFYEETLLGRRLVGNGRALLEAHLVQFDHPEFGLTNRTRNLARFLFARNRWIMVSKSPPPQVTIRELVELVVEAIREVVDAAIQGDSGRFRARWKGSWLGLRAAIEDPRALDPIRVLRGEFPSIDAGYATATLPVGSGPRGES